ncbi:TasA family protein [Virgibacillus halophilus]|uniref:TasA family protein n=1 Tax=Tigheibacillus halophilus TaxID=361280 RepID=UPI0036325099
MWSAIFLKGSILSERSKKNPPGEDKLKDMSPKSVTDKVFDDVLENGGLEVDESQDMVVEFEFVDSGEDQNQFQGDSLKLEWTFYAKQMSGKEL